MKQKKYFTCQTCGYQSPKWLGRCPDCQNWNSFAEETFAEQAATLGSGDLKSQVTFHQNLKSKNSETSKPKKLLDIHADETKRFQTKFSEFDRVLGGGLVPGSLVLLGGDPGIGKSTILMQALSTLKSSVLYVSGEESAHQIKLRAMRLGVKDENFLIYAENNFELIAEQIEKLSPQVLIIDSIQTIYSSLIQSAPGSVSQIRECTARLLALAKTLNIGTFLVGHITKEGTIAGPKILEHMVDTVLYFENSTAYSYRLLRAVKNRFGSTNEIGVFEMAEGGLKEVKNPSELFLQERPLNVPGTVVVSAIEGSRPVLVEIQALVSASTLAVPRRTTLGVDHNKVSLLVAIIEKKLGMPLYGHDIFVNVAGGLEIDEPAADLGIVLALISSFKNKAVDSKFFVCGEVGLAGEVRSISQLDQRISEAKKLGFTSALVPSSSLKKLDSKARNAYEDGMKLVGISTLQEVIKFVFE